jgi:hypothetical protein
MLYLWWKTCKKSENYVYVRNLIDVLYRLYRYRCVILIIYVFVGIYARPFVSGENHRVPIFIHTVELSGEQRQTCLSSDISSVGVGAAASRRGPFPLTSQKRIIQGDNHDMYEISRLCMHSDCLLKYAHFHQFYNLDDFSCLYLWLFIVHI